MVIIQEIGKAELDAGVFFKRGNAVHQPRRVAIGSADVIENVFGGFLFQLDVTALGCRNKAVLDLARHTARGVGKQCRELIFKVIFFICLTDEIKHGQALFVFGQTQAAAKLLQEDRQRFRGPQEQNGVDLRNIDAFVVNIHNKDEAHFAGDQLLFGAMALFVGGFAGQEHGLNAVLIEIPAHEFCVIYGNAEAEPLHVVNVRHIFQQRGHHEIGALLRRKTAHGVEIGKLGFIVAAGRPFQLVQIHRIGHAKILEGAEQLAVDGFRQTDLRRNAVVEIAENALAIHAFRRGGQTKQELRLIVFQQLLIGRRRRVMEFVHDDVIVKIRRGF